MGNLNKTYEKIKKEKGVTLIALVITIIAMLILAGITINMGTNAVKDSKEDSLLSELRIVQNAILQRKTKSDLTKEPYPGEKIIEANIDLEETIEEMNNNKAPEEEEINRKDNDNSNYYFLSTENGGLKELGITNSEDAYIVNYKTGEVINYTTKLTGKGKILYIYAIELIEKN